MGVKCDYCHRPAKLVPSSEIYGLNDKNYGMFWLCPHCDAYVGTHKNSSKHAPLGRLANKELRRWKQNAHALFDPLWKSKKMSRSEAYAYLQEIMGMTPEQAHIGKFDVEDCKKLVSILYKRIG